MAEDERPELPGPPGPRRPRRKTFGGAILAASMIGVQDALEGPKEEPTVIEVGSGAGHDDDPVAVDLDPDDLARSIAVVRPWLQR